MAFGHADRNKFRITATITHFAFNQSAICPCEDLVDPVSFRKHCTKRKRKTRSK